MAVNHILHLAPKIEVSASESDLKAAITSAPKVALTIIDYKLYFTTVTFYPIIKISTNLNTEPKIYLNQGTASRQKTEKK